MKLARCFKLVLILLLFVISLCGYAQANSSYNFDTTKIEELRIRDGLPNFFDKLKTEKEITVGYIGGSITKAEGWRVKSFEWLEKQYPKVKFKHVNAALSGTGADIGAARLQEFVLPYHPDLLFVEYRVNASGIKAHQGIEGIVRRIKAANPETDICFVYTLGIWMTKTLSAGKQTRYGSKMEEIANYYGIPSIDFAPEVLQLLKADKLSFKVPKKEKGKLWFTKDNCHPTEEGHDLYRDIIARSFIKMSKQNVGKTSFKKLPEPIYQDHYNKARFLALSTKKMNDKWEVVDVDNDEIYNVKNYRTKMMMGEAVIKTNKVGASYTVTWNGPYLGYSTLPNGKDITIAISVDGNEPEIVTFNGNAKYRGRTSSKMSYVKQQSSGSHTATFTVRELGGENYFYLGQFMELKPE
ncbi:SGNH/GDSL hydrolase family protein [Wenyingzhuangia sp. IMCC45574]